MLKSLSISFGMLMAALGVSAQGLSDVIENLSGNPRFEGSARFAVTMPQLADDVVYQIDFLTNKAASDRLSPCDYLIEWDATTMSDRKGFSAYFDGHHFRYPGNDRIQEYHFEWDSIPFMPEASARGLNKGVQRTAQFVDILPPFLGEALQQAETDPSMTVTMHTDTIIGGHKRIVADVVATVNGIVARESEYVFDRATLLPVRVVHENSPGSISEQTVTIDYDFTSPAAMPERIDEAMLIARYPAEFASFRRSNFSIETLRGKPLPGFSLPTTTGERYSRLSGDSFRAPTLIVLLEGGNGFNTDLVKQLREAADMLPFAVDVVWVFTDTHIDTIEQTVGSLREGEHLLMSGRGLVRDCGAAMLPTIIFANPTGTVADVIIGYNNNLASDVIQKMTLLNNNL